MTIKAGSSAVSKFYTGSTAVSKIQQGLNEAYTAAILASFIGMSAAVGDASTHPSISVPLVVCADGDYRFILVSQVLTAPCITPSGWTLLGSNSDNGNQVYSNVFYRQKLAGDTDSNVTVTFSGSPVCAAASCAFTGISGLGAAITRTFNASTDLLSGIPSITTTAPNSLVVAFCISTNGNPASNWSTPQAMFPITDGRARSGSGTYGNFGVFHEVKVSPGATGVRSLTLDNGLGEPQCVLVEMVD